MILQRYKSHKIVEAARIDEIVHFDGWTLVTKQGPITVSDHWLQKHEPMVGGYYVRYADGYESYFPASAFEPGYELLPGPTARQGPSDAELENRFRYHPPTTADQRQRHHLVSEETLRLAKLLRDICPNGRDLALALTGLEDVRMRANAAIACNHDALPE